jgi:hypothetical protein
MRAQETDLAWEEHKSKRTEPSRCARPDASAAVLFFLSCVCLAHALPDILSPNLRQGKSEKKAAKNVHGE